MQTAIKFYHLFKRFQEVLACRIILWLYKEVYKNNTKTVFGIILYLNIQKVQTLQLQEKLFHTFKFLADFIWQSKLFQIFGPKLSKLLVSKVTCLFLGIFKFSLYCSLTGVEHNLSSKISFIKPGFKLFQVSYFLIQSLCFLLTAMENLPDFSYILLQELE